MTSLQKKTRNGRSYYYAMDVARVDGKPRIVRQRYLGTVEAIEAAFDAAFEPTTIDEVEFGATAAIWQLAQRLNFGLAIDARQPKRAQGLSVGAYLQAAAVNRAVAPCSKRAFHGWYERTVLARILPAEPAAWASQRFWDAMHRLDGDDLAAVETQLAHAAIDDFGVDPTALAFDTTNFHTFIASDNTRNSVARRGHAKNKRHDLRLVGLALACSTDHQVPLASTLLDGNTADVTAFHAALPALIQRLEQVGVDPASVTVVFDKGNNSAANLNLVDHAGVGFVGSLVPSQHPDLLDIGDHHYSTVQGIGGVTAHRTTKTVFGADRSIVITRSDTFLHKQLVGLAQTRARVETQLRELDRLLAGGRHRMTPTSLQARVDDALAPRWMTKLYPTTITGDTRKDLQLTWSFDPDALDQLITRELGKRIIFSDRHHWTTAELVTAYRSQWQVEAAFRQIKNPDHAGFRPIHHWTDQKIAVHSLYSVAALMLVNLAWRQADRAGLHLSPNEGLHTLAAIREVTLLYPPAHGRGGSPRILRKLTRTDQQQQALFELFQLHALAPRDGNTAKWRGF